MDVFQSLSASFTYRCIDSEAKGGHLKIVQWFHSLEGNDGGGATDQAVDNACAGGHLEVAQWLHRHREVGCTTSVMSGAATKGHLHVLEWLEEYQDEGFTIKTMDGEAPDGHIFILKRLAIRKIKQGVTMSPRILELVAQNGQLETIKWLLARRKEKLVNRETMEAAASNDRLKVVQFLFVKTPAYKQDEVITKLLSRNECNSGVNILHCLLSETPSLEDYVSRGLTRCAFDDDLDLVRVIREHHLQVF